MTKMCVTRVPTLANSSSPLELRCATFQMLCFKLEFFIFAWPPILGSLGLEPYVCQAHCARVALSSGNYAPPSPAPLHPVLAAFHLQWPVWVQKPTLLGTEFKFIPTLATFPTASSWCYQLISKKQFKDVVSCCLDNQGSSKLFPLENVHYLILCIASIAGV